MRLPILVLFLVLGACGEEVPVPTAPVHCPDPVRGCTVEMGGKTVKVFFSETPQPMRSFEVRLEAPQLREARIEFSMAGMDMGPGRYQLVRGGDGVLRARVTLPVCVAGRSDWLMTLRSDGAVSAIPFQAGR